MLSHKKGTNCARRLERRTEQKHPRQHEQQPLAGDKRGEAKARHARRASDAGKENLKASDTPEVSALGASTLRR